MEGYQNPFGQTNSLVHNFALGVITSFSGGLGLIPSGWQLCDGTNGTPDLRDKFVVGSGSTYAVDETGGSVNHNHDFTGDEHIHEMQGGTDINPSAIEPNEYNFQAAAGTTDNAGSLAPFYSLAFIQFIGD